MAAELSLSQVALFKHGAPLAVAKSVEFEVSFGRERGNKVLLAGGGSSRRGFTSEARELYSQLTTVADVAELADALDSKSSTRESVWVRPPPSAPFRTSNKSSF